MVLYLIPRLLNNWNIIYSDIHSYNTRNRGDFRLPINRIEIIRRSPISVELRLINLLLDAIKIYFFLFYALKLKLKSIYNFSMTVVVAKKNKGKYISP